MNTCVHEVCKRAFRYSVALIAVQLAFSVHAADDAPISFNREIRPILAERCFRCHGPDAHARKSELRLDVRDDAIQKAFTPGDAASSRLLHRITHDDLERRMPPPEMGDALTEDEIDLIADWIDEGAPYEQHWAYVQPTRPNVPEVQQTAWPANPIDHFILARLEAEGIEPSPDASPTTLTRRMHFDLLGLPATPADRDRYRESDHAAYVDRLLASPHFGEQMAIGWLDLVRYADSTGYHGDEFWDMFPYRDYVINAFNENKPFDVFTIEQLAGDLIADAKQEHQIASAYNRLNQVTTEGGANRDEYRIKYASDRARTTASTWLGATIGCAECHDHKFDPISTREFFSFTAFFADVEDPGAYMPGQHYAPYLELPSPDQASELDRLTKALNAANSRIKTKSPELLSAQVEWEARLRDEIRARDDEWATVTDTRVEAKNETTLAVTAPGTVLASGETPFLDVYTVTINTDLPRVTGIRLEALDHENYRRNGRAVLGSAVYNLSEIEVRVHGELVPLASAKADIALTEKFDVAAAIDGDDRTGWAPPVSLFPGPHQAVFAFAEPVATTPNTPLEIALHFTSLPFNQIEHFQLTVTDVDTPELGPRDGIPKDVVDYVLKGAENRTRQGNQRVTTFYQNIGPATKDDRIQLIRYTKELQDLKSSIPKIPITKSQEPRTVHILTRGDWMNPSDETVTPAVPSCLPPPRDTSGRLDRMDLANWIVSDSNPLTARVFVNRLWKHFFGTGLSNVLDDLGSQGEWPTHPELLDWLAVEFMDSGWDVKHMVRLMTTTHAYRQSSAPRYDLVDRDPYNRLYARQHRARIPAELVRDNALSVSGLLNPARGGRSIFPYQPEGYYDHTNTQTNSRLTYETEQTDNQFRRGLYVIWKRSFLHPSLQAFDAPTREECTAQRPESNTPLQALVLLNDPTYVEAARTFAERIVSGGGVTLDAKLNWAFEQAVLRPPAAGEVDVLSQLYERHRNQYDADPDAARELLSIGIHPMPGDDQLTEIAAWTSVARTLLNLHETVTRS